MIRQYFRTAWRTLLHNRTYSILNIAGLAAGMAVALLIGLWVHYQFSFDRFLPGNEQVYKAGKRWTDKGEKHVSMVTPLPLAEALKRDVAGVKYVAVTDWMKAHGLQVGDKKLYVKGAMAGSDFLKIFQYPLVSGNRDQVLQDPYSIVLNESTAKALFGDNDPTGQMITIDNQQKLKVTGIMKDVPGNSTLQFNFLVPFDYFIQANEGIRAARNNWEQTTSQIYVALEPGISPEKIQPILQKIFAKYSPKEYTSSKTEVVLQPLEDWHLFAEFKNGVQAGGFIDYVRMFALIGILVLIIACINFVNLSTARSEKRAREVGVRKAIGSSRLQLVIQFMVESALTTLCAFVLALVLLQLALPAFSRLTGASLAIPYTSIVFWLLMLVYVLVTALLAGCRPAFYLSSFRPVKVLKGKLQVGKTALLPRKVLVVLQFTCSIALIICTVIIYQQIQHGQNRPTGYNTTSLVMTDASSDIKRNYVALKNELLASGAVTAVTKSSTPVTENRNFNSIDNWPGKKGGSSLGVAAVGVSDGDYFKTVGMQLLKGRNFEGTGDSLNVIINEAAVQQMGLKEPLNQLITWDGYTQARIIGVAQNAIMGTPFDDVKPTLFAFNPQWANVVSYRIAPTVSMQSAMDKLTAIFSKHNPGLPYLYKFADEDYARKFQFETLVGRLAAVLAILAIFISCLGLFGLSAFTTEQRTKEIGIRKVLGASVAQLWLMLSREFLVLVAISVVIASPIAIYFLSDWLSGYSYRIALNPLVFIGVAMAAIIITLVTVSFQSIKASITNPVRSLKEE
jgi:putative ABC transport system permease protein